MITEEIRAAYEIVDPDDQDLLVYLTWYLNGEYGACKDMPGSWGDTPADEELERAFEEATLSRTPADPDLFQRYNSLVGDFA